MKFVKTRSGRYLNVNHIIALSVEETKIEIQGKKRLVYKVVAYMSQPLLPAVIGIYYSEEKARSILEDLIKTITHPENIIAVETEC
ncbi:MAG: hypothetical protein ACK4K4_02570 [Caldimicrobium sp.]